MSSSPLKEKTIYEEWLALPEDVVGEIIMGELIVSPRPAPKHTRAASQLGGIINGPFDSGRGGPGGWIILDEPEVHINGHIFVPDLAGWRREIMPRIPDEAFFTLVPSWICEVLSPSTSGVDRVKKMPLYAELGVSHFWLIDPIHRTLEIYSNDHLSWRLVKTYAGNDMVRAVPFDAVEVDLSLLWA